MATAAPSISRQDWGLLLALSILWGGSFFFIAILVRELPPFTIVFIRVLLAAAMLLPVLWLSGLRLPRGLKGWMPFAVMGVLNNVIPFSLIVSGQTMIPSGLASVVNATTPLFTVLVVGAMGDEALNMRRLAGVLLGFAGVVILSGDAASLTQGQTLGVLLCLAAACVYGFSGWWARRHLGDAPPLTSATCQLIASSGVMAVLAIAFEQPWTLPAPSMVWWLAMIGFAGLSTALAYILFFGILKRAGAGNVMLVTLLNPVTAILLGHFVLGEAIVPREIAGALVIGSALLVVDGRVLAWFGRKR